MFNRDALFGKKDEAPRNEPRSSVNVTPGLGGANPPMRPQGPAETPRPDLRFADVQKPQPSAQAPQQQPARAEESTGGQTQGSRLIVGPDIKLKGVEITDCDTLVVEGRVEASMDSRVIQIAEAGVFSGTVSIDVAEIRGCFEGDLTARKQLVIYSTGRVSGNIRYGKIRIEEGGELSGDVSTLSPAAPAATTNSSASASSSQGPQTSAPAAAPVKAEAAPAAAAPASRPAQSPLPSVEPQPAAAAAGREPAPSRKQGGKANATGMNAV